MKLHTKPRLGAQRSTARKTWFLVHLQVPALFHIQTKADCCEILSISVVATYPYHVRKSSTVKQQNNEKQPDLRYRSCTLLSVGYCGWLCQGCIGHCSCCSPATLLALFWCASLSPHYLCGSHLLIRGFTICRLVDQYIEPCQNWFSFLFTTQVNLHQTTPMYRHVDRGMFWQKMRNWMSLRLVDLRSWLADEFQSDLHDTFIYHRG